MVLLPPGFARHDHTADVKMVVLRRGIVQYRPRIGGQHLADPGWRVRATIIRFH